MMKHFVKYALSFATASVVAGSAFAFERTPVTPDENNLDVGTAAPLKAGKSLILGGGQDEGAAALVDPSAGSKNSGTDIWIPGLGVIGKMPNLNFGLELLYGDKDEVENLDESANELLNDDELTIKGTIKKTF